MNQILPVISMLFFLFFFTDIENTKSHFMDFFVGNLYLQNLDWDSSKTRLYYCNVEIRHDSIVTSFKVSQFLFSFTSASL